jgi:hypothetical protein
MMRWGWMFALAALTPSLAHADTGAVWEGVWQGKVGNLPVRVCLTKQDGWSFGAYYYLKHLKIIHLDQIGESKDWTEGERYPENPAKPRWTFDKIGAQSLSATWQSGAKRLPITLTRAAAIGEDEVPCGSAAFNGPRATPARVESKPAKLDGRPYTKLTFMPGPQFSDVSIEGFVLDDKRPAVARVNAQLRARLPGIAGESDYLDCLASSLGAQGTEGDYSQSTTPSMITQNWLAATVEEGAYCGGAHPYSDSSSKSFDLRLGTEVNLQSWFGPTGFTTDKDGGGPITPALRTALLKRATKPEKECEGVLAEADFWGLGLTRQGMRFSPSLPRVVLACSEDVTIPYAELSGFLNAKGKAGVASVVADLK